MKKRWFNKLFWWSFATVVVTLALLLTAARALFPYADSYRQEVETWAGGMLGQSITITEVDARWRYTYPEVVFRNVNLLDDQGNQLNTLAELSLSLDIVELLINGVVSFVHLEVALDKLTLQRDSQGEFSVLEFTQPSGATKDSNNNTEQLLGWLLQQGDISVTLANFSYHDQKSLLDYNFSDVTLVLANDDDHHQISGNIQLPFAMGASLAVEVNIQGNPLKNSGWQAEVFLAGESISLPHWFLEQSFFGQSILGGSVDFQLWSEWQGSSLSDVQGEVSFRDLELESLDMSQARNIESLHTQLNWQRLNDGWQLGLEYFDMSYQQHLWPQSNHRLRMARQVDNPSQFAWQSDYLPIADISDLLNYLGLFSPQVSEQLAGQKPQGELHDLEVVYLSEQDYSVQGRFSDISLAPWHELPGLTNLNGSFSQQTKQGQAALSIEQGQFEWPSMFRQPLMVEELSADISWMQVGDEWSLNLPRFELSNQHIAVKGAMDLQLPVDNAPFLDLALRIIRVDAEYTSLYLPVGMMGAGVVEWLDQGIVAGQVTSGGLIYHGSTANFPFKERQGQFDVNFIMEQAMIVPGDGWQAISNIDASVRFLGSEMSIAASNGQLLHSKINQCTVDIKNMLADGAYLSISGSIASNAQDIIDYLLNSPVASSVDYLEMFRVTGTSDIDLSLEIPLSDEGTFSFDAHGELQANRLKIIPADLTVDDLSGRLHITTTGLDIEQVTGQFYKQPISLSSKTISDSAGEATVLQLKTQLTGSMLTEYLGFPIFDQLISGQTPLDGLIFIPHQSSKERFPIVQLSSMLQGVKLDLPGELYKAKNRSQKLSVNLNFAADMAPEMELTYGNQMAARLAFEQPMIRGQILFGEQTPQLPIRSGIELLGELSYFSLSPLLDLLPEGDDENSVDNPSILNQLNLKIDKLELFDQQLNQVSVIASENSGQWVLEVDSLEAKGGIKFSNVASRQSLVAKMEYLHLSEWPEVSDENGDDSSTVSFDMNQLPAMKINIDDFRYDQQALGSLQVKTVWLGGQYHLKKLLLQPDSAELNIHGKWIPSRIREGSTSTLVVNLKSDNLGRTMNSLGYAGTIDKSSGFFNADLQWSGTISEFDLVQLQGEIDFKFNDGQILAVELGAGRILGLLSIQMLPRRLLFDFNDLFSSGFSFDEMRAHYKINDGVAITDSFTLLGPSARVDMLGKVDFVEQEYDQQLIITPFVTESLPMLTFLTGLATPQVAAAIYLAQKLFQDDLEKFTQFEYQVTGPWAEPVVSKVGEKSTEVKLPQ